MSVNKVILIGNVGQDPRVKYFDTGSAVATFPLATTDRGYTLANGTQIPERTEWHIRTRSYSDQSGAMRYITEIFVDNMEMLSPKGANTGAGAPQPSATQAQQPQQMQQPQQQAQPSQAQPIQDNPADRLMADWHIIFCLTKIHTLWTQMVI